MELWDAYNSNFEIIDGMTLIRGEEPSIPKGVYHMVVDILVRHTDGTNLIMQRDPRKSYPMAWEATAGGSALKGENPLEAAMRELREETGIKAKELTEIKRLVRDNTHAVYVEFYCETDCAKDSIILQEGETIDYKWISEEELFAMPEDEMISNRMMDYLKGKRNK